MLLTRVVVFGQCPHRGGTFIGRCFPKLWVEKVWVWVWVWAWPTLSPNWISMLMLISFIVSHHVGHLVHLHVGHHVQLHVGQFLALLWEQWSRWPSVLKCIDDRSLRQIGLSVLNCSIWNTNGPRWYRMVQDDPRCSQMFLDVPRYSSMFLDVPR